MGVCSGCCRGIKAQHLEICLLKYVVTAMRISKSERKHGGWWVGMEKGSNLEDEPFRRLRRCPQERTINVGDPDSFESWGHRPKLELKGF